MSIGAPRASLALFTLVVVSGCVTDASPGPTSAAPTTTAHTTTTPSATARVPGDTLLPSPTPTASDGLALTPGRPFDAAQILEAMRASRRPGGVPDELETAEVAAAIADAIWTVDGEPWTAMTVGGTCGTTRCTLDVGGSRAGAAGEDLWTFEIVRATGEVIVLDSVVRSMPIEIVRALEVIAERSGALPNREMLLVTARWLGPGAPSRFRLFYRSGDAEDGCEVDLTIDAERLGVVEEDATGC